MTLIITLLFTLHQVSTKLLRI